MAAEMTGEGTSYGDLVYDLNLNDMRAEASEFYGVGFRKGSDLVDAFNEFWKQAVADGTVEQIAATYGLGRMPSSWSKRSPQLNPLKAESGSALCF